MNDPVTTIFPVIMGNKVHAAFVMDAWTDSWATHCGKRVPDPERVVHKVQTVECVGCADNIRRARNFRDTLEAQK